MCTPNATTTAIRIKVISSPPKTALIPCAVSFRQAPAQAASQGALSLRLSPPPRDGLLCRFLGSDETWERGSALTRWVSAPLPGLRHAPVCSSPCPQAGRGTAVLTLALLRQSRLPPGGLAGGHTTNDLLQLGDLSGIQLTCASSGLFGDILRLLSAFGKKGYKLKPRCYQYGTFSLFIIITIIV